MSNVPKKGDLVYINFTPQAGRESKGKRPAIVLSPEQFNKVTGFATLCPITNTKKGWGYEVELPDDLKVQGVILTDHLKNLDWQMRGLQIVDKAPDYLVEECMKKIRTFLSI